jgi:hypothetical protein
VVVELWSIRRSYQLTAVGVRVGYVVAGAISRPHPRPLSANFDDCRWRLGLAERGGRQLVWADSGGGIDPWLMGGQGRGTLTWKSSRRVVVESRRGETRDLVWVAPITGLDRVESIDLRSTDVPNQLTTFRAA